MGGGWKMGDSPATVVTTWTTKASLLRSGGGAARPCDGGACCQ
jgi:hypothetical protein